MHMTTADDGETVVVENFLRSICALFYHNLTERHILGEGITFTNSVT
jgi:hypothetical protein